MKVCFARVAPGRRNWCHVSDNVAFVFSALFSATLARMAQASLRMTHPHGDGQAAVDVSFLEPALLHDASSLRAQRGRVLTGVVKKKSQNDWEICAELLGRNHVNSGEVKCWLWNNNKKKKKLMKIRVAHWINYWWGFLWFPAAFFPNYSDNKRYSDISSKEDTNNHPTATGDINY